MRSQTKTELGIALLAAFALAGCHHDMGMASMSHTRHLTATLSGAQEVPPTQSNGTGKADLTYDPDTHQLTWNVNYGGLTSRALAAHIHGPASPTANAGVVVNLAPNNTMSDPLTGSAMLTDTQAAQLLAGQDYINIHTANNKNGEIRGQITPAS